MDKVCKIKRVVFVVVFTGLLFFTMGRKIWAAEDILVSAVCSDTGAVAGKELDCEITLVDMNMENIYENLCMTAFYQLDSNAYPELLPYTLEGNFVTTMQFGDAQTFHMKMVLPGNVCEDSIISIRVGNQQTLGQTHIELEQAGLCEEEKLQGQWMKSGNRWWYRFTDGNWIADTLAYIDGKIYGFDKSGWMITGWGMQQGVWYYFSSSGSMLTGWINDRGIWYYMKADGIMATGWSNVDNQWYYLKSSGAMAVGWVNVNNQWYYLKGLGTMAVGWVNVNSRWYYMKNSGAMAIGWIRSNGKWYYLTSSGAMATGWIQSGGKWYYLYGNGSMAENTSIQGYRVGTDGAWIR